MMRVDEGGGKDYEEAFDGRGQGELGRGEDDVDDKGDLCCGEKSLLSFLPIIILIESPKDPNLNMMNDDWCCKGDSYTSSPSRTLRCTVHAWLCLNRFKLTEVQMGGRFI